MASLLNTKWISDDAVNDQKIKLRNNQYLRARNNANDGDINVFRVGTDDVLNLMAGTKLNGAAIATTNDIPSTFRIQGNWNASTNTPALSSGVNPISPLEYPLYIVSVSGSTTLDGNTGWVVGDKAYFANGQWYKADNNDAVVSVNGANGVVVLDSDDISEGGSNLYHTVARARTAAVVNSTAGSETDQAPSVSSIKSYITTELAGVSQDFSTQVITLSAGDITNGYITLANEPIAGSIVLYVKGSLVQVQGEDYEVDGVELDQINFLGTFETLLVAGDKVIVTYAY